MKKLSVLLGLRDKIEKNFANMLDDMHGKFKNKQALFMGFRKTYQALEGFADDDTKRGFQNVSSTVDEQLSWFKEHTQEYFETILSIEKTNACGVYSTLIVNGDNWGIYSTLELLRLKSILDGKIKAMIHEIPVRSDGVIWKLSPDSSFSGRNIWESPTDSGHTKTTIKRSYILPDPHPNINRPPIVGEEHTQVNTGQYTSQVFVGSWSLKQRADLLVKYDTLYKAVIEALESANDAPSQVSELGDKVLNYLID